MTAKTLMIQGTTSHAGKSMLVTALCRIFKDFGYKVAPFKSQNMSLNSYVNEDGYEIARSQVVQAMAAKVKPIPEHNPVLLKPKGDSSSQIILLGKPYADYDVKNYYIEFIPKLIPYIKNSLKKLQEENDVVIIEGAGSPAEINLADVEIANMFIAKLVNSPVLLIADIDRGGVFASLYGTVKLLKPEGQNLIKYFIINKFRGDIRILEPGVKQIEELIGKKCLGVLPYIHDLKIPAEDSFSLEEYTSTGQLNVKIIQLPRISNFTDFEALNWEAEIKVSYVQEPKMLNNADLIVIPGTKNTIKDLNWMKKKGFFSKLSELEKEGYLIVGICGGYQILGEKIIDMSIESNSNSEYEGLGFLPIETTFKSYHKVTKQIKAKIIGCPPLNNQLIEGYEIHMGIVKHKTESNYLLKTEITGQSQEKLFIGTINKNKNIFGSFIHGFWDNDKFRKKFIEYLFARKKINYKKKSINNYNEVIEQSIKKIAKVVKNNVNIGEIKQLIGF